MARKKSLNLTEGELPLMQVLWEKGRATVGDVVASLPADPPLAYSTVLTTLRILEAKGYVRHTKEGRAFVYEPVVVQEEASRKALDYLVNRFFGGSCELLVDESAERRNDRSRRIATDQKDDCGERARREEMTHVNFAMTTLLNGIWEGTLLAVAMWLFLKLLPRLNPTTRFTVLWVTLLAVVALLLEPFTSTRVHSRRANGFAFDCSDKQSHDHDSCTR